MYVCKDIVRDAWSCSAVNLRCYKSIKATEIRGLNSLWDRSLRIDPMLYSYTISLTSRGKSKKLWGLLLLHGLLEVLMRPYNSVSGMLGFYNCNSGACRTHRRYT